MPPTRPDRFPFLAALLATATCGALAPAQAPDPAAERHPETTLHRIAFGSCAKESRPQPIWSNVLAAEPDLWIWAGDNVYGDTEDMEELRGKYAQLAALPGYAELRAQVPILATWDDHDMGRNDAGFGFPQRRASQQVFLDFFGVPADSPRRTREGVYHAAKFGPEGRRVQVILLDTRSHRSDLVEFETGTRRAVYRPTRDRDARVLGDAQWKWLEARLREPAELRLIVSSIQFLPEEQRFEKWANFPLERDRMLRLLRETRANGVLFLSGDRHHAELSRLPRDGDYPLYDLTASGINQSFGPRAGRPYRIPEDNAWRVGDVFKGPHFGTVEIDWEQPDPVVSLRVVGLDSVPLSRDLKLGDLHTDRYTPRASTADSRRGVERHVVDGDPDEWRDDSVLEIEGRSVHGRFSTGAVRSLTSGDEAVCIVLDLDGSDTTGATVHGLDGADVSIEYNPLPTGSGGQASRRGGGGRRPWEPRVTFHGGDEPAVVNAGFVGLQVQPTCASRHFEFRIDRFAGKTLAELGKGAESVEMRVVAVRHSDGWVRQLAAGRGTVEPARSRPAAEAALPSRDADTLRFVSWNVLWASPQKRPTPFARVFRALRPDVVLIQEWDTTRYSEHEISSWFAEHVDGEAEWQAMVTGTGGYGQGTAVLSRHPILARAPAALPVEDGRWNFPARLAAALIDAPQGRVLASSAHLKAGGSLGSPEDARRAAEVRAINQLLRGMSAVAQPDVVVCGGDWNLNGSTEVVELLTRGLDLDRSRLELAQPRHLGDPQLVYTHGRGPLKARFDYLAFSDVNADAAAAFVLDTTLLDQTTREAAGLQVDDTAASDHFPVVLDLRVRARRPR